MSKLCGKLIQPSRKTFNGLCNLLFMNSGMEGYSGGGDNLTRWLVGWISECFTMVAVNVVDLKLKRNEANELGNKITADQVLNSHG